MDRNAYQMLIAFNRETKKLDDVYRSAAKSCGISECAFWILYTLRVEEKSFTQAEICEFLIEPKQTVNSALKKLEAEGYLTLSAGADQRSKRVCLTEKGEQFVKAHVDRVPEAEAAALGAMTAAERDALIRLTGRYRALFAQKLNCIWKGEPLPGGAKKPMKRPIQLSDHFTYRKLLQFVFPSIVMMIFTSIYGVVDGLFVSNYAGKTAFAAINLVMPFIMVLGGIGFMIGTGGTALVSKILGEGDQEKAKRYFSMMILFTVLVGLILTVLGVVFMEPVALFLGATPEMLTDCVRYGRIVNAFTAAFMLQNVFQSFLIAAEKPKLGLAATVAAGVTNMVLDALFVAVFHWGIAGAAIATGLSQCVGGLFPLLYFLRPNTSKLRLVRTKLELQPILNACGNGSSELMSNISSSIVSMVYNFQLLKYLGEDGVSAYGVLMYVQFVFVAIYIGYSIGCAPIVGFHYGAQNHPELKNMLRMSVILMSASGVVLTVLARVLAAPLAKIFVGYDEGLFTLTCHAFRLFSFAFLFAGFNIFASSFFTALGNGLISAAISFLRTLVFQTSSVILLPLLLGVDGIWYAITAAEIFATLISIIFLLAKRRKYHYM